MKLTKIALKWCMCVVLASQTIACSTINLQPVQSFDCDSSSTGTAFCAAVNDVVNQQASYANSARKKDGQNQLVTGIGLLAGIAAASAIGFEGNSDLITGTALAVGFSGPLRTNLNIAERARIQSAGANAMACVLDQSRILSRFNHQSRITALNSAASALETALTNFEQDADLLTSGSLGCPAGASANVIATFQREMSEAQESVAEAQTESGLATRASATLTSVRTARDVIPRIPADIGAATALINSTITTRGDGALPNLEQLITSISQFRLPESDSATPAAAPAAGAGAGLVAPRMCSTVPDITSRLSVLSSKLNDVQTLSPDTINQAVTAISRCPLRAAAPGSQ